MPCLARTCVTRAKAAIKKSPVCYRSALWLYFRLFNLRITLLRALYWTVFNVRSPITVTAWRRTRLLDWLARRLGAPELLFLSAQMYQLGDEAFHRGRLKRALKSWNAAAEVQSLARARVANPWGTDALILTSMYWTKLIGHIALLDALLKLAWSDRLPARRPILFVRDDEVANPYLLRLLSHLVTVERMPDAHEDLHVTVAVHQQKLNILETKAGKRFLYEACYEAEAAWQTRAPLFAIPQRDAIECKAQLAQIGLLSDDWFVTLHVRGPRYWREGHRSTRNAGVANYVRAVQEIIARGGRVVWLGESGTDLPAELARHLINYADSALRSPMLDVFLCAACRFFIGTSSGISHVPGMFGVSAVFTNVSPPFSRPWRKGDLWIPRTLAEIKTGKPLPFLQALRVPLALLDTEDKLQRAGYRALDCEAEDIRQAAIQMCDQIDARLASQVRDEDFQAAVDHQFAKMGTHSFARLARSFCARQAALRVPAQ